MQNQKHPKTSPAKPGPSIGAAYQTDSEVQQGSSDTASAQQLPPSAAKEVLDALRAEKQQQRRERRQLRKQATQVSHMLPFNISMLFGAVCTHTPGSYCLECCVTVLLLMFGKHLKGMAMRSHASSPT